MIFLKNTTWIEILLIIKKYLYWEKKKRIDYIKKLLVLKFNCIEKLVGFKNWMDGKTTCDEKLLGFRNWLDGKNTCTNNMFGFKIWLNGKTTCIGKLFGFKN